MNANNIFGEQDVAYLSQLAEGLLAMELPDRFGSLEYRQHVLDCTKRIHNGEELLSQPTSSYWVLVHEKKPMFQKMPVGYFLMLCATKCRWKGNGKISMTRLKNYTWKSPAFRPTRNSH